MPLFLWVRWVPVGFSLRSADVVDCCGKRRFLLGLPSCPAKVPLYFALCFSPCHLPALYMPWTLFSTAASRLKIDEPRSAFAVSVASLTQTYFKISERNRGFKDEMFALRMHRGKILQRKQGYVRTTSRSTYVQKDAPYDSHMSAHVHIRPYRNLIR